MSHTWAEAVLIVIFFLILVSIGPMVRATQRERGGDTCPALQGLGSKSAILTGGACGSIDQISQGCQIYICFRRPLGLQPWEWQERHTVSFEEKTSGPADLPLWH